MAGTYGDSAEDKYFENKLLNHVDMGDDYCENCGQHSVEEVCESGVWWFMCLHCGEEKEND